MWGERRPSAVGERRRRRQVRKDKGVMNIRNTTDRYCEVAQCVYFAVTFTFLTPDLLCLSSLASTILERAERRSGKPCGRSPHNKFELSDDRVMPPWVVFFCRRTGQKRSTRNRDHHHPPSPMRGVYRGFLGGGSGGAPTHPPAGAHSVSTRPQVVALRPISIFAKKG